MSLCYKIAGLSNTKIQPIRAQPGRSSTNERGPVCLGEILVDAGDSDERKDEARGEAEGPQDHRDVGGQTFDLEDEVRLGGGRADVAGPPSEI